jgi:hypothetical protein
MAASPFLSYLGTLAFESTLRLREDGQRDSPSLRERGEGRSEGLGDWPPRTFAPPLVMAFSPPGGEKGRQALPDDKAVG